MNNEILTKTGTNELEIIEFNVGAGVYGINVAKVSQIANFIDGISEFPNSPAEIEGMINYRGTVIPVVNLFKALNMEEKNFKQMMLITKFNNRTICFIVGQVIGIHKDTWENIESSSNFMNVSKNEQYITGVLKKEGELISLVDFESIISRLLGGDMVYDLEAVEDLVDTRKQIIFAEDSSMIAQVLKDNLKKIGFTNIKSFTNGKDMWEYLYNKRGDIDDIYCVLSDIEMPKMDGLTLCKKVKEDDKLKELKVILFSSLITAELRNKGETVGADAQISKPDMGELIRVLKQINSLNQ